MIKQRSSAYFLYEKNTVSKVSDVGGLCVAAPICVSLVPYARDGQGLRGTSERPKNVPPRAPLSTSIILASQVRRKPRRAKDKGMGE